MLAATGRVFQKGCALVEVPSGAWRGSPDPRPSAVAARQLRIFARRLALLGAIVVVLLLLGAAGLAISEGSGFWYSFRWALDTAATVGGFPQPASTAGQIVQVA